MYYDSGVGFSYGGNLKLKLISTQITAYDDIRPDTNNNKMLGGSSTRWSTVYCVTLNESSDEALKENIVPLTKEKGLDFISSLNPIQYNMIGDETIHTGFTAQHVKEEALAKGYTEAYGLYTEELEENDTSWGLVYRDFIAPLVASIKELKKRIEILEGN